MQRAVILLDFLPNHRFTKRIDFEKGIFDLHLICRNRCIDTRSIETSEEYTIHEFKIKSEGNPLKRLPQYYMYSKEAINLLNEIQPRIIHVQGIDMLRIAYKYKRRHADVKIIYEIGDLHKLVIDKQTNPIFMLAQLVLKRLERHYVSYTDLVIITSMKFYDDYLCHFVSREKILYMPNVPDLKSFATYKKKTSGTFTVGFIGNIRYKDQIKNLLIAGEKLNMKLLIAGFEPDPKEIELLCSKLDNVEYSGRFDFDSSVADLYGKCDVMYSVYNADMKNVSIAIPNKLYEAVFCEIPLIVAKNTYLAQIVEEWEVGVAVNHRSIDELVEVLEKLRSDRNYYERFLLKCKEHQKSIDLDYCNEQFKQRLDCLID